MLKFTDDHEWLRLEDGVATVGITQFAVEQLGDIVFAELPTVGAKLTRGGAAAVVESVKAASEIYAPLDGEVVAINEDLAGDPSLINKEPTGRGWFFKMKLSDETQFTSLKNEGQYRSLIGS